MSVNKKIISMNDETRLALLEQSIGHIDKNLNDIKSDIRNIRQENNDNFKKIDNKFEKNEFRLIKIEEKIQDNFRWTIGIIITLFSGLYATALGGMIARLCHWI